MPYLLILGVPAGLAALGFFVDKTGEGIESASNGFLKIAAAFFAAWLLARQLKLV